MSGRPRPRSRLEVGLFELLDGFLATSNGLRVVAQSNDCIGMARKLSDQTHFDALQLKN